MKLLQAEEITSQRQLKQIEVSYPQVLIDIKEYKGQSDLLTANLIVIDNAILAQTSIADDSVVSVDLLLNAAVENILKINVRATTTANTLKNDELAKLLSKPDTYYRLNTKEICVQKLETGLKLLQDKKLILVNILPADLTNLEGCIDLYKTHKDDPRAEVVNKKTDGTDVLKVAVKVGAKIKKLMIKLLVGEYKYSLPALAEKAVLLGTPIELGKRHNVGSYAVINKLTEEPVITATITEVKTTKEKKHVITKVYQLDGNGMRIFNKHILGQTVLTVVAPGFLPETMVVIFKKNEPNEFVIGLTKVLPK